ncbi:sporulation histidine kinase inhibitor Sda [Oceanobacillus sp. CFH 90083]|uniref:sporulation histidine kinase inhibitor Sda n=1 Tax=Oceanobacillus sp. CFH 90083 TaxID=2592336 RepID=UPI00128CA6F8|nr:sporulation histidine kinase inhibitor Sda [Oceanobacillus sp. CFH 90083]
MNSLRHLSDELLKESLRNAIKLKLEQDFCTTLKNEIKKRAERREKSTAKAMDMTNTFEL